MSNLSFSLLSSPPFSVPDTKIFSINQYLLSQWLHMIGTTEQDRCPLSLRIHPIHYSLILPSWRSDRFICCFASEMMWVCPSELTLGLKCVWKRLQDNSFTPATSMIQSELGVSPLVAASRTTIALLPHQTSSTKRSHLKSSLFPYTRWKSLHHRSSRLAEPLDSTYLSVVLLHSVCSQSSYPKDISLIHLRKTNQPIITP